MTVSSRLCVAAASAALLVPLLVATPASAASSSVSTLGELQAAIADCSTAPNTITLAADIIDTNVELETGCNATIVLGTFNLTVRNIVIGNNMTLEVTGPTDGTGGTLTVDVSGKSAIPGIRNAQNATFKVSGANVHATGGLHGAAIGGGGIGNNSRTAGNLVVTGGIVHAVSTSVYGAAIGGGFPEGDGGTIVVSGGAVSAVTASQYGVAIGGGAAGSSEIGGAGAAISVTGGTLSAIATDGHSTAIGGGLGGAISGGAGGSLAIGESGTVIASSPRSAFGGGDSGGGLGPVDGSFGLLKVDGMLYLPAGRLIVSEGSSPINGITVSATGRILGSQANPAVGAEIIGIGAISNWGAIALTPPTAIVSGNNRLVTFDTSDPDVRVFAPSFATGYRTLPAPPIGKAWNTASDGSGSWFNANSSTTGMGHTNLYAVVPATLGVSTNPADLIAAAGSPFAVPVTANGPGGAPLSPQPAIALTSSDCTISGTNVFEAAGACTVSASTTVQSVTLTVEFTINVFAGPVDILTLTPSESSVAQGGTLNFTVAGADAYGNPVDTTAAVLTSSVSTDEVSGHTVKFPQASPHTITATLGDASATTTVQVIPAPPVPKPDVPTSATGSQTKLSNTGTGSQENLGGAGLMLIGLGTVGLVITLRRRFVNS